MERFLCVLISDRPQRLQAGSEIPGTSLKTTAAMQTRFLLSVWSAAILCATKIAYVSRNPQPAGLRCRGRPWGHEEERLALLLLLDRIPYVRDPLELVLRRLGRGMQDSGASGANLRVRCRRCFRPGGAGAMACGRAGQLVHPLLRKQLCLERPMALPDQCLA